MNFLKKHYEKILLAFFLVIFVIALLYQIEIITSSTKVTQKDLQLREWKANYKKIDFNADQYNLAKVFKEGSIWDASTARTKGDEYFTDLLIPFDIVRCIHCHKLIPAWYLYHAPHECPICHGELRTPDIPNQPKRIKIDFSKVTATTDSDAGGLPDLIEKKYGLDPAVASDDNSDIDDDGFSNAYEYTQHTKINDAKSHPPLYKRLYLDKLVKNKLNFTLENITLRKGAPKKDWDIQINFGKNKTDFFWLGDTMKVDGHPYKIIDMDAHIVKKQSGNIKADKVEGWIKIKSEDGKEVITAKLGKDVFSPNPRAIIIDSGNDRKYSMNIGDVIEMGNKATGVRRYQVKSINATKGEEAVTIFELNHPKKTFVIDANHRLPQITRGKSNDMRGGDNGVPGMDGAQDNLPPDMMQPPQPQRRPSRNYRRPTYRRRPSRSRYNQRRYPRPKY